jgi:hypothetical protein
VIVLWDGRGTANDGQPYENSYAWFMKNRSDRDRAERIAGGGEAGAERAQDLVDERLLARVLPRRMRVTLDAPDHLRSEHVGDGGRPRVPGLERPANGLAVGFSLVGERFGHSALPAVWVVGRPGMIAMLPSAVSRLRDGPFRSARDLGKRHRLNARRLLVVMEAGAPPLPRSWALSLELRRELAPSHGADHRSRAAARPTYARP